jgi:CRP-like cAMP-binding protein
LREFYELVVQAHAAGILTADPAPTEETRAVNWPVRIPAPLVAFFAGSMVVISAGFLVSALPHWRGPGDWTDIAGGWLAACALLSIGQVLAACAIAGGGEVRAARLFWRTGFPRFQIDTAEAIMGGRICEVAVAASRTAPILAGAAVAVWAAPGWLAALCAGGLSVMAPFGDSAARQGLASRRRAPRYSIRADLLFAPVRADLWARWTARTRAFWLEFGWLGLAWTLVWGVWLVIAFTHCLPKTTAMIGSWARGAPRPIHLGAEYLLIGVIALGLLVSVWAGLKHWWLKRAWSQPIRGVDARDPNRPPLTGDRPDMLAQVPLFRGLDQESRAALATAMTPVDCSRGETVIREDDPGDEFFVIVEGEMEVRKRLPGKRRAVTIGWMGPGDSFGEIALLENTVRTATVVASRPTRLLKLSRTPFEQLVVGRVGTAQIRDVLQHARFLGRLTFTAGWSFTELVLFAHRCRNLRFEADTAVLTRGEPNQWFYLIYDGAFEARDGKRVLRRMGPGDYFGEISLLEGWAATATVVAVEESRCLALCRTDFLELFARDFRVGLRMEAQAELRLGASVFASR